MAEPRFEPGQSGWGSTGWGASRGQSGDSFLTGELPGGGGLCVPLCPPHMPQHTALGLGQLWTSVQGSRGPCAHGTGPARRPSPGLRTADHTRQHRTRWGREHPGGRCCTDGSGHGGASSPGVWLPLEAGSSRDQPGLHCGLALGPPSKLRRPDYMMQICGHLFSSHRKCSLLPPGP